MKSTLLFFIATIITLHGVAQKVVFLHHSTGGNVFYEGDVASWISNYNTENNTSIEVTERAYPDSPWPWDNYPYDYWKLWVDGSCNSDEASIECMNSIAEKYDVVIFKHCFPGASIQADNGDEDITSREKTLPNYKLQYRALRALFDSYPNTKFIAWTLAPLHRKATNADEAARANEFANWVKNDWLTEEGKAHPNIFVFDFYGLAAELTKNPTDGQQYSLKYEYEGSHDGDDSHPNTLANQTIGPIFGQRIVDVALTQPEQPEPSAVKIQQIRLLKIYPSVVMQGEDFTVINLNDTPVSLTLFDADGKKIRKINIEKSSQIFTATINPGLYFVSAFYGNQIENQKLIVK